MSIFYAILLGIIQGLTEFLPISSSGHLVAAQEILKIEGASMTFDVILHLGTLVAVFIFYWKDILGLINEFFKWIGELVYGNKKSRSFRNNPYRVLLVMIVVASIPTAIFGLALNDLFTQLFESVRTVGFALLITGIILWVSNNMLKGRKQDKDITFVDALTVGFLQGIAITPGISRSGTTIFAGLLRGFNRELATRFSFLISIPTILGAAVLEIKDVFEAGLEFENILPILAGFVAAAVSGYFAIRLLIGLVNHKKLHYFSYYCWALGIIIIIYSLIFH